MNGIATIRTSLEQSRQWFTALMADARDAPTTFPTPKGGNHPLWVIGHLAHSEASLVARFILGEKNPLTRWDSLFGMNSEPVADASRYPSMDELMGEFGKARANTLKLLDSYTDADLDKPSQAPKDLKMMFGTVGQCFLGLGAHCAFHAGQVADARRAMGRKPLFR